MCEALGMASVMIRDLESSISFRFSLLFGTDPPLHSLLTSNVYLTAWLQKISSQKSTPMKCFCSFVPAYTTQFLLVIKAQTEALQIVLWRTGTSKTAGFTAA